MTSSKPYKPALIAAGALVALVGFIFLPSSASAETMVVSPPKFDFSVAPGGIIRDTVRFKNNTDQDAKIFPAVLNFTFRDGDEVSGSPETYPANEVRTGTEIAPWVEMDTEPVIVPANGSHSLPFTIIVPTDAQPGGHFGVIEMLVGHPGVEETGVGVTGGFGSLIFMKVEGDVDEKLTLTAFHGDEFVYRHLPIGFQARLENSGNTHLRPVGSIFIKDVFGRQVASLSINPNFQTILPGSARRFGASWDKNRYRESDSALQKEMKNFALGKYEATIFLNYGEGKTISDTYTFWVMPWLALGVWAVIILALVLLLVFGLRSYNKMIIKKFQNQKQ